MGVVEALRIQDGIIADLRAKLQQAQETLALTCEAHLETRVERDNACQYVGEIQVRAEAAERDAAEQRALAEELAGELSKWSPPIGLYGETLVGHILAEARRARSPQGGQEEGD